MSLYAPNTGRAPSMRRALSILFLTDFNVRGYALRAETKVPQLFSVAKLWWFLYF